MFTKKDIFVTNWYPAEEKFRKKKLGSLYKCTYKDKDQDDFLVREMNFDRISSYQVEGYFNELTRLYIYKLAKYVVFPKGIYISEKNDINLILPCKTSLYELIHSIDRVNEVNVLEDLKTKYLILRELARILNTMNTIMPPMPHGHLSSHNVFISVPQNQDAVEAELRV